MSDDYVLVPRRLIEELVACLEGGPERDAGRAYTRGGQRSGTERRAAEVLEPQPGRVSALEREMRRIDTGGEVVPEAGRAPRGGAGSEAADPTYCEPRIDSDTA